jgi:hypothetical protein
MHHFSYGFVVPLQEKVFEILSKCFMQCFEQVFYEKINMFLMKSFERVILTLLCRVAVIYKYSWFQEQSRN